MSSWKEPWVICGYRLLICSKTAKGSRFCLQWNTRRPRAGLQLCTGLDHFTFIAPLCATVGSPALEYYRSCFTYPCGVFWAFEELMKMLRLPGNPVRHVGLRGHTQTKHIVKIIVLKDLVNAFFSYLWRKQNAKKLTFTEGD